MLADDGRCKTLDAAANGYVRSEAGGCLIMVPAPFVLASGQQSLLAACALLAGEIAHSTLKQRLQVAMAATREQHKPLLSTAVLCLLFS